MKGGHMKKSIIIVGAPRSGKSTLAQKIVNELEGYSIICADNFTSSYMRTCKMLGVRYVDLSIPRTQSYCFLENCMYYENSINYVFDTKEYDEEIIEENKDKFFIIFLGYSKLTAEELFDNIRQNDKENDWTYIESNWKLKLYCESFIEESKEKEQIAKDHNYWYIDTSYDRDHTFYKIVSKLKEMIDD